MKSYQFKRDAYKKSRGSWSRLLDIMCRKCENKVLIYQKDGPGELRRLYFDRILDPQKHVSLQDKSLNKISPLKCYECNEILGTPYIYDKENRKAYRLYVGSIIKKVRKLK